MKKFGFRAFRPPKGMLLTSILVVVIGRAAISRCGYATVSSFSFHWRDSWVLLCCEYASILFALPFNVNVFLRYKFNYLLASWPKAVVASHTEDFPLDAGESPESSANDKQATSQKRREQVREAQRYVPCCYQFVWFSRAGIPSTVGHIASAKRST